MEKFDYTPAENIDNCIKYCPISIFGGTEEDVIKNAIAKKCSGPKISEYITDTNLDSELLTGLDGQIRCGTSKPIPGLDDAEFSPFDGSPVVGPYELSQEELRARS